jgi:predicted transcriptional regulator
MQVKMMTMQSIHDIKAKAKAHKITMAAVCNEAGIQQSQVSRWLSGTVEPLWTSVNQLHLALEKLIDRSPVVID